MEDIFDLSVSKKEQEFVKAGLKVEMDVSADIVETFCDIPYVGSLIKLGRLANKFKDLHFIRKLARFLEKEQFISEEKKEKFLNELSSKQRKRITEYITHYLLHAEDDAKADIMGFIYKERLNGHIDDEMFLRLCSIVDRAFVRDLQELPSYIEESKDYSVAANSFINLGLIDNFVGGYWVNEPTYQLNETGKLLHDILHVNNWFSTNDKY
jgi:hypothetical protein